MCKVLECDHEDQVNVMQENSKDNMDLQECKAKQDQEEKKDPKDHLMILGMMKELENQDLMAQMVFLDKMILKVI